MDLIYTNARHVDQGVLSAYAFDLSFGASENDFELKLGASGPALDFGAFVYIEGTEHGGVVDAKKTSTDGKTITYTGRTWHGMMDSKVIEPDPGASHLIVNGDANDVLTMLIDRLGLGDLFAVSAGASGITIKNHKFARYCLGYDGIADMLADHGAKLKMTWENRAVCLSAVPIVDYTTAPVDADMATLTVELHGNKVNHLICLGQGELAERDIIHLYADRFGQIIDKPYYTGIDERCDVYENTSVPTLEELWENGVKRFRELREVDKADISKINDAFAYDIGDIVGALDVDSGITVTAAVTQKIVRINNGAVSTEYKTEG